MKNDLIVQVNLSVAMESELYRDTMDNLHTIAYNLSSDCDDDEIEEQNECLSDSLKTMKAVETFYRTPDVLPEYNLKAWIDDVFGTGTTVGATVEAGDYACILTGLMFDLKTKEDREKTKKRIEEAFKRVTGKKKVRLHFSEIADSPSGKIRVVLNR